MKKWLFVVVLCCLFAIPFATEASANAKVMKTTSVLSMKSDALNSAKNVLQLSKGSLVIVTAEKSGFSKVSYNGKNGYIVTTGLTNATPTPKVVTRSKGLVVKAGPTAAANSKTTLQVKTIVEDFGKVNDTYHLVQYGSVIGYAHKNAIQVTKPTTQYVVSDAVTIYASANTKASKRQTLAYGEQVKVHGTNGSWSYVTAGSKYGYITKSALSTKKPVALKGTKVKYDSMKSNIRYTTSLRDPNGQTVLVHFVAVSDIVSTATSDDIWAGASEGDTLYYGDYKLALQIPGAADAYMQAIKFDGYTYNKTRDMVYQLKGKTAKDTDFIAVAETWSSAAEGAKLYYVKNGALHFASEIAYILKPKSIGNQKYQYVAYIRQEYTGYIFRTDAFNVSTGKWTAVKTANFFDDKWELGSNYADKFAKDANYYLP